MTERIDRRAYKARVRTQLETAQVSPRRMVALWLGLRAALSLLTDIGGLGTNLFYVFLVALTLMLSVVLDAGFVLYCMTVRRGERAGYLVLFDGFECAGKVILLVIVEWLFVALWSLLFVIPGLIAAYRYRFALYNLLENPELGVMEALSMSKRQTQGFKGQIFMLDLSYLGWGILASLPELLYRSHIQFQIQGIVGGTLYWNMQDVTRYINPNVLGMPQRAWEVLILVWALVVSLYYRAHYQCVELAYFDTAKQVSGVGEVPVSPASGEGDDDRAPYEAPAPYRGANADSDSGAYGFGNQENEGGYGGSGHGGHDGGEP